MADPPKRRRKGSRIGKCKSKPGKHLTKAEKNKAARQEEQKEAELEPAEEAERADPGFVAAGSAVGRTGLPGECKQPSSASAGDARSTTRQAAAHREGRSRSSPPGVALTHNNNRERSRFAPGFRAKPSTLSSV